MKMTERYADTLQAREIITDFLKWAKHKPFTEATLDEYFGIDRAALEAEAKDATSGTTRKARHAAGAALSEPIGSTGGCCESSTHQDDE